MKSTLFLSLVFFYGTLLAQNDDAFLSNEKVIIDNEKVRVIEHFSLPSGEVCGEGMHHHKPHLTVLLTDAKVLIKPEKGESQVVEVKSGTSLWSEAETHSVSNLGDQPTKMILVYLKDE